VTTVQYVLRKTVIAHVLVVQHCTFIHGQSKANVKGLPRDLSNTTGQSSTHCNSTDECLETDSDKSGGDELQTRQTVKQLISSDEIAQSLQYH
jgi:hypothetical protein